VSASPSTVPTRQAADRPGDAAPATGEVIGILGGMGPAATADFYAKLVSLTPARRDQDHPRVVIWADPTAPDRSLALLGDAPDPSQWLVRGARILARAGATVLGMPCNTAHAFLPLIAGQVGLPVVDMVEAVAQHIRDEAPSAHRVGVLATTGTIRVELYQAALRRAGLEPVVPDPDVQDRAVMAAIRAIKAGDLSPRTRMLLGQGAQHLAERGADALIAGCTEVPLGLDDADVPVPLVDPTTVLAAALLRHVGITPAGAATRPGTREA
jgi:aspartate racemase